MQSDWKQFAADFFAHRKAVVLTDTHTRQHCLPQFEKYAAFDIGDVLEIAPGESSKNFATIERLCCELSNRQVLRQSAVVCLGGGVVGDVGGFLAGIWLRGIHCIQVPTSLLAMVDASVGGKTAINLGILKNQVGVFHRPDAVVFDPVFLKTLPPQELLSGKAEVVKHRVLKANFFFGDLLSAQADDPRWTEWIADSVSVKNEITVRDYRENGDRRLLNMGHTVGHALESYLIRTKTPVPHGFAVAWGLATEAVLARRLGLIEDNHLEAFKGLIRYYPLPNIDKNALGEVLQLCSYDKKNQNKEVMFALPHKEKGGVWGVSVTDEAIFGALKQVFRHA